MFSRKKILNNITHRLNYFINLIWDTSYVNKVVSKEFTRKPINIFDQINFIEAIMEKLFREVEYYEASYKENKKIKQKLKDILNLNIKNPEEVDIDYYIAKIKKLKEEETRNSKYKLEKNKKSERYKLETSFSIYDNEIETKIKISCDPAIPENVRIFTESEEDKNWYGDVDLSLTKEQVDLIIESLIKQRELMDELEN